MEMFQKAQRNGLIAGVVMMLFHFITRNHAYDQPDHGLWSIMGIILGVQFFSYGIKMKDITNIIVGIVWFCITTVEFVLSVKQLKNGLS